MGNGIMCSRGFGHAVAPANGDQCQVTDGVNGGSVGAVSSSAPASMKPGKVNCNAETAKSETTIIPS